MMRHHPIHNPVNRESRSRRALAQLLAIATAHLPLPAALRLADAAGTALWWLSPRDRGRAEANLKRLFGGALTPTQRRSVALASCRNRCKRLVELERLPRLSVEALRDFVRLEGLEHIQGAQELGRGAILVSNHFCSPELIGARLAIEDVDLAVVARLDRYQAAVPLVRRSYRGAPFKVMAPDDLSGVISHLRGNGCVAILPETHHRRGATRVSVGGLPVWIAKGVGAVVMRTGCVLVPGLAVREPDNRVRAIVSPPLELETPSGSRKRPVEAVCEALTELLMRNVERYPGDWLWLHHEWRNASPLARTRTSPALEPVERVEV